MAEQLLASQESGIRRRPCNAQEACAPVGLFLNPAIQAPTPIFNNYDSRLKHQRFKHQALETVRFRHRSNPFQAPIQPDSSAKRLRFRRHAILAKVPTYFDSSTCKAQLHALVVDLGLRSALRAWGSAVFRLAREGVAALGVFRVLGFGGGRVLVRVKFA